MTGKSQRPPLHEGRDLGNEPVPNANFNADVDEVPTIEVPALTEVEAARLEGYWRGVAACQPFIDQAQSDANRYYRIAAYGGFGKAPKGNHGFYFPDLFVGKP